MRGDAAKLPFAADSFDAVFMSFTLLAAIPRFSREFRRQRITLPGTVPSPIDPPTGCPFHPRCFAKVGTVCGEEEPPLLTVVPGQRVACHLYPPTR
jgi:peptide/nickel transport system ATP-binding protein